ncbi:hypothetical protein, variant [Aphanomyces astaci]|nr:hypothetical protein, variant [Aphanomyces astaci]ETV77658.1 hypothetical protein, variant [Aphanomyces astaci]|eukprot:XP_009832768.1 hypothetical protein, variant [Aphanomyces astaci]
MRGTTTVRATVAEVVQLVGAADTADARKAMRRLHGKNFVDTMTLARVHCGDDDDGRLQSCHVKWAAFKESDTSVDYCFVEFAGVQVDARGSPLGFCILSSIERPKEVMSMAALGFRRDEFHRTGFLVYPSLDNPEAVHVTAIAQSTSTDKTTSVDKLEATLHHRLSRVLLALPDFVTMRRLGCLPAVDRSQWIQDACRKFCAVCLKSFHFLRKHHCRMCGEVVCGTCAVPREVDLPSLGSSALVRVCSVCVGRAHAVAGQQVQVFSRQRRPSSGVPPRHRTTLVSQVEGGATNNQLALDPFDVVDRQVLAQHYNRLHRRQDDDHDLDIRTTLGTADGHDDMHQDLATTAQPQRATSRASPNVPTTSHRLVYDSSGTSGHEHLQESEPHQEYQGMACTVASVGATQLRNVQELSLRLTRIRDMLNQNSMPPPSSVSTSWVMLSPSSVPHKSVHTQRRHALERDFEVLDDDDVRQDVLHSNDVAPELADNNYSSNDDDGGLDDSSGSLHEEGGEGSGHSNGHEDLERSTSDLDSNDEDIHDDFRDDEDEDDLLVYNQAATSASFGHKAETNGGEPPPSSTAAKNKANLDGFDAHNRHVIPSDVDDLRFQISHLHHLLALANQKLDAVEASVAQSPQTHNPTHNVHRTVGVVELQTGNSATDPCVVQRRHAHRAVVLELHAIMGLDE